MECPAVYPDKFLALADHAFDDDVVLRARPVTLGEGARWSAIATGARNRSRRFAVLVLAGAVVAVEIDGEPVDGGLDALVRVLEVQTRSDVIEHLYGDSGAGLWRDAERVLEASGWGDVMYDDSGEGARPSRAVRRKAGRR